MDNRGISRRVIKFAANYTMYCLNSNDEANLYMTWVAPVVAPWWPCCVVAGREARRGGNSSHVSHFWYVTLSVFLSLPKFIFDHASTSLIYYHCGVSAGILVAPFVFVWSLLRTGWSTVMRGAQCVCGNRDGCPLARQARAVCFLLSWSLFVSTSVVGDLVLDVRSSCELTRSDAEYPVMLKIEHWAHNTSFEPFNMFTNNHRVFSFRYEQVSTFQRSLCHIRFFLQRSIHLHVHYTHHLTLPFFCIKSKVELKRRWTNLLQENNGRTAVHANDVNKFTFKNFVLHEIVSFLCIGIAYFLYAI